MAHAHVIADARIMLAGDDFGADCLYRGGGGKARPLDIRVHLSDTDTRTEGQSRGTYARIWALRDDLGAEPEPDDIFEIGGVAWRYRPSEYVDIDKRVRGPWVIVPVSRDVRPTWGLGGLS